MPIVLVHGNPETPSVWEPLRHSLERVEVGAPVHCPHLPGFGVPVPDRFGATKEEYADWLIGELERIAAAEGPADLVGHDWGGAIGMRAVSLRPDLVRSWACDVLGLFHPDYVWHDVAQIWQTPGEGEAFFERRLAEPAEERVARYHSAGIPSPAAEEFVAAAGPEMTRCVLALYRSAAQPAMARWGEELAPAGAKPGLALIAPEDPFVRATDLAPQVARSLGAGVHELDDQGHWWMLSDPDVAAAALAIFWGSL